MSSSRPHPIARRHRIWRIRNCEGGPEHERHGATARQRRAALQRDPDRAAGCVPLHHCAGGQGARQAQRRRELPTLTASVTGTDLWGKSADGREIVALIDGNITLNRKGAAPIAMGEAKTVYVMEPDAPPPPVVKITLAQLNAFAQETEMQPGAGAAGKVGNWKIYAARTTSQEEALAIYERVRDAGYAAAIQPAVSQGKQVYQVRIAGLLTEADGVAVAIKLRVQLGLQDVRVSLQ
jgi:hypothetical protein